MAQQQQLGYQQPQHFYAPHAGSAMSTASSTHNWFKPGQTYHLSSTPSPTPRLGRSKSSRTLMIVLIVAGIAILAALAVGAFFALRPRFAKRPVVRFYDVEGNELSRAGADLDGAKAKESVAAAPTNDVQNQWKRPQTTEQRQNTFIASRQPPVNTTPVPRRTQTPARPTIPSPSASPVPPQLTHNNSSGRVSGISYRDSYLYVPSYSSGKISILSTPDLATIFEYQCQDCTIYDVAALRTGDLVVAQGDAKKITKVGPDGSVLAELPVYYSTKGIAVSAEDYVFVLPRTHDAVEIYDSDLNHIGRVLIPHKQPGDCNFLDVDNNDVMYVSCQEAIYVFSIQGELKFRIEPPQGVTYAVGIAVDSKGNIMVVRRGEGVLDIYDSSGNYVEAIGESGQTLWSDIAVGDGYLYVVDYLDAKIKVFKYDG